MSKVTRTVLFEGGFARLTKVVEPNLAPNYIVEVCHGFDAVGAKRWGAPMFSSLNDVMQDVGAEINRLIAYNMSQADVITELNEYVASKLDKKPKK